MMFTRLAIIGDFVEERWPSMDLVAEMLCHHLQRDHSASIAATLIRPPMRRRLTENGRESGALFNADRLLNRFWDYPRFVRDRTAEFDLFHVVDHSYGQLLHELPSERTIITCHDLDTFRCLLNPEQDRRSFLFRKMMERTLSGFRRAARVACVSAATRAELLRHRIVEPERTVVVPNGVHPSCSPLPDEQADREAARLLGEPASDSIEILHVGSTIPRKRIDVLLEVFAEVRKEFPAARLVRAGGDFTREQEQLISELDLTSSIVVLPHVQRNVLAAVYRRAAVVLQPSAREGFGLPVVEGLACGAPVIASDLPVLREVGGDAAKYCPVGDVRGWTAAVVKLLGDPEQRWPDSLDSRIAQASKFTWAKYTNKMAELYQSLL